MLSLQSFEKSYSTRLVLKIDHCTLEKGIYWLKGANGTGKSTLIKCIAGLLPFKGNILVNDVSLKKNRVPYRQKINFADAEPLFPEFLTGEEMIQLFIKAKGGTHEDVNLFTEIMDMKHFLQTPVGTYSSGMLKKLSLALAFIGKPDWILLDEPFITLDNNSLTAIQTQIKKLYEEKNTGILFSSHQTVQLENLPSIKQIFIEDTSLKFQYP